MSEANLKSNEAKKSNAVLSMTGFGGADGPFGFHHYRVEVKSVNHRFLDLKIRLPRELQSIEVSLKALIQSRFARGSIELKVERVSEGAGGIAADLSLNIDLARRYHDKIKELQTALGLKDPISTKEIADFPDVLTRGSAETSAEETWKRFEPLATRALDGLAEMRAHEGSALARFLGDAAFELTNRSVGGATGGTRSCSVERPRCHGHCRSPTTDFRLVIPLARPSIPHFCTSHCGA